MARTIVSILAVHVNKAEAERTLLKPPATWQAYDYYMRAGDTLASYWSSFKVEQLYEFAASHRTLLVDRPKLCSGLCDAFEYLRDRLGPVFGCRGT